MRELRSTSRSPEKGRTSPRAGHSKGAGSSLVPSTPDNAKSKRSRHRNDHLPGWSIWILWNSELWKDLQDDGESGISEQRFVNQCLDAVSKLGRSIPEGDQLITSLNTSTGSYIVAKITGETEHVQEVQDEQEITLTRTPIQTTFNQSLIPSNNTKFLNCSGGLCEFSELLFRKDDIILLKNYLVDENNFWINDGSEENRFRMIYLMNQDNEGQEFNEPEDFRAPFGGQEWSLYTHGLVQYFYISPEIKKNHVHSTLLRILPEVRDVISSPKPVQTVAAAEIEKQSGKTSGSLNLNPQIGDRSTRKRSASQSPTSSIRNANPDSLTSPSALSAPRNDIVPTSPKRVRIVAEDERQLQLATNPDPTSSSQMEPRTTRTRNASQQSQASSTSISKISKKARCASPRNDRPRPSKKDRVLAVLPSSSDSSSVADGEESSEESQNSQDVEETLVVNIRFNKQTLKELRAMEEFIKKGPGASNVPNVQPSPNAGVDSEELEDEIVEQLEPYNGQANNENNDEEGEDEIIISDDNDDDDNDFNHFEEGTRARRPFNKRRFSNSPGKSRVRVPLEGGFIRERLNESYQELNQLNESSVSARSPVSPNSPNRNHDAQRATQPDWHPGMRPKLTKTNSYAYKKLGQLENELSVEAYRAGRRQLPEQQFVYGIVSVVENLNDRGAIRLRIMDETAENVAVRICASIYDRKVGPMPHRDDIIRIHRATVQYEGNEMVISTTPHRCYTLFNYDDDLVSRIQIATCADSISYTDEDKKRVLGLRDFIKSRKEEQRAQAQTPVPIDILNQSNITVDESVSQSQDDDGNSSASAIAQIQPTNSTGPGGTGTNEGEGAGAVQVVMPSQESEEESNVAEANSEPQTGNIETIETGPNREQMNNMDNIDESREVVNESSCSNENENNTLNAVMDSEFRTQSQGFGGEIDFDRTYTVNSESLAPADVLCLFDQLEKEQKTFNSKFWLVKMNTDFITDILTLRVTDGTSPKYHKFAPQLADPEEEVGIRPSGSAERHENSENQICAPAVDIAVKNISKNSELLEHFLTLNLLGRPRYVLTNISFIDQPGPLTRRHKPVKLMADALNTGFYKYSGIDQFTGWEAYACRPRPKATTSKNVQFNEEQQIILPDEEGESHGQPEAPEAPAVSAGAPGPSTSASGTQPVQDNKRITRSRSRSGTSVDEEQNDDQDQGNESQENSTLLEEPTRTRSSSADSSVNSTDSYYTAVPSHSQPLTQDQTADNGQSREPEVPEELALTSNPNSPGNEDDRREVGPHGVGDVERNEDSRPVTRSRGLIRRSLGKLPYVGERFFSDKNP